VSERGPSMRDLPSALSDAEAFSEQLVGRLPAGFLDYDGTLTPIVDRQQDAVIPRACERRCVRWRGAAQCALSAVVTGGRAEADGR
jgi:trehalose 6-phosphate phosphatase